MAGAGSSNIKSTTAANLAAALATLGVGVELCDLDPAGHSTRALTGAAPPVASPAGSVRRVTLDDGHPVAAPARLQLAEPESDRADLATKPLPAVLIVECAPRLDARSVDVLHGADLVLVPVDASPLARRAIDEVAAHLLPMPVAPREGGALATHGDSPRAPAAPRLRAVLSRLLPRATDRWALVDAIEERHPGALYGVTVPMGRRTTSASGTPALAPATLYSPAGRAAAAYRALAGLVARDLGLSIAERRPEPAR